MTQIPKDWSVKDLGDLATITIGRTPARAVPSNWGGDRPWATISDLEGRHLHSTAEALTTEGALGVVPVPPGTVVMSFKLSLGKVAITSREMYTNEAICHMREPSVDRDFLYYALAHYDFSRSGQQAVKGVTLNREALESIQLLVPDDLVEQARIAEELAGIDDLVDALADLADKKRHVAQAVRDDLTSGRRRLRSFLGDWTETTLRSVGFVYSGLSGKSGSDFQGGNARFVEFTNVLENVRARAKELPSVHVDPRERQNEVCVGDLLLNASSETPNEVALASCVGEDMPPGVFLNSFCFGFRPFEGASVDSEYLAYFLRSSEGRKLVAPLAQGSTRYNISKRSLLGVDFLLPELKEQQAIAQTLRSMDEELASVEILRGKFAMLREGLAEELLTGRTRLT